MPFSSGTFTFTSNTFAPTPVTGTTISSTDAASTWSEIATGLTTCVLKDGTQTATALVPFAQGIGVSTTLRADTTTVALLNTTATAINAFGAGVTVALGTANTAFVFGTTASFGTSTGTYRQAGSWIPQRALTTAYTTVAADANTHFIKASISTTFAATIDSNTNVPYPVGTAITFATISGTLSIAITDDAMYLAGSGSTGTRTLSQYGLATALKIGTTSWVITGSGLS